MKIESQIKNLLARYGRVSLPGRGVFRCVSECARVEDGKVLPPVVKVVFERCDAGTDRMLVEAVMKDYEIGWNEACEYINNVTVDVDEVVRRWDYLPQNFGLRQVELPQVRIMPVKWLDAKYAAVVAVAALLNLLIPFNKVNNNLSEAGTDFAAMSKVVMINENSLNENEDTLFDDEEIVVEEMHYIIVVASFETQEAAMRCITEGRTPCAIEIIERDGRCRVCGMRFASYDEASNYIRENSLKAWVMKL